MSAFVYQARGWPGVVIALQQVGAGIYGQLVLIMVFDALANDLGAQVVNAAGLLPSSILRFSPSLDCGGLFCRKLVLGVTMAQQDGAKLDGSAWPAERLAWWYGCCVVLFVVIVWRLVP